jgi:hypothetical protein
MANRLFNNALEQIISGGLDLNTDDFRVLLLGGAGNVYTFDPDDVNVSDLTPGTNELGGTGYARGTLAGEAVVQNDTDDRAEWDATDLTFATLNADNGNIDAIVIYEEGGGADATRPLVAYIDTANPPLPFTTDGGNFVIEWNAAGILHATSPA